MFDRFGYQKFNPADMPVAGRSSDIRASVGDLFGEAQKSQSLNVRQSTEFAEDRSVSRAKPSSEFFDSFKSRKSLREIQLEKQKSRDEELNRYPGIAHAITKSPIRAQEARMLGASLTSSP